MPIVNVKVIEDVFTPVIDSLTLNYTTSTQLALPVEERTRFAEDLPPPPGAAMTGASPYRVINTVRKITAM